MTVTRRCLLLGLLIPGILATAIAATSAAEKQRAVTLFAAVSTAEAVTGLVPLAAERGIELSPVFAASSTLARQIERGAPADLYLSANVTWMDYLIARGAALPETRRNLLANELVLVAPPGSPLSLILSPGVSLAAALGDGILAMANPDHVPAGIYAKQALENLGFWDSLAPRVARTANVRAALALVARGEAAAGIVYRTDVALTPQVRIVDTFPAGSHEAIVYPLAIVAGHDRPAVRTMLKLMTGRAARAAYERAGFPVVPGTS